jgi:hypothetical protein
MVKSTHFSHTALVFHGKQLPEEATVVGYGAIIHSLQIEMPLPTTISIISNQNKRYRQDNWEVFPNSYLPLDTIEQSEIESLYKQLIFALKYEGVNLLLFKKLTQYYDVNQLNQLVDFEPTGQYTRRIWFLIEWLSGMKLLRVDLLKKSYVKLVDESLQYAIEGARSP